MRGQRSGMSDKEDHSNDITWPKDTIQASPHAHKHSKGGQSTRGARHEHGQDVCKHKERGRARGGGKDR
eukprot:6465806-Amphidinium_carterae.1